MRKTFSIAMLMCLAVAGKSSEDPFSRLALYNGTWEVTRSGSAKPDKLVNQCARTGHFYVCDQSVNGGPSALLVFIARTDKPDQFYTQNIRPEGRATSRADLQISGETWTFLSNWNDGGRTVFYKTVNTFVSKVHIHYEQSESPDNKEWKVTNTGDETKAAGKR